MWRNLPVKRCCLCFLNCTSLLIFFFPLAALQREAPVRSCSTANLLRRLRLFTTTCRIYSRALSDRFAWGKTAKRRTHDAWPTAGAGRASARRPSGFWGAWLHARTRKWLSGRSRSPAMTSPFSERHTGQKDFFFFSFWPLKTWCCVCLNTNPKGLIELYKIYFLFFRHSFFMKTESGERK